MAPVKRFVGPGDIFRSDQQIRPVHRRIHPARVIRPNHGFNPGLVQNPLSDQGICC